MLSVNMQISRGVLGFIAELCVNLFCKLEMAKTLEAKSVQLFS